MAVFADFYNAGNIPEDVINTLWDPSVRYGKYTNAIAHIGSTSSVKDFLDKTLRTPNAGNKIIDGGNSNRDDTSQGIRYEQPMQLADGNIVLGDQAMQSDSFGNISDFSTQLGDRAAELDRDCEANALSALPSIKPTAAIAAQAAGFFAQVSTATSHGATGSAGGWNSGTGVFDAPTDGTTRALSETDILSVMEQANTNGANLDQMHMIPALKTKFSNFMMTSSSRIGTLITNAPGDGTGATAVAAVDVYVSDHGTVEVVNNRLMQPENSTGGQERTNVAITETAMANCVDQWTPRAERLGRTGAGDTWQVTSSRATILLTERSHAGVFDINYTLDMVA